VASSISTARAGTRRLDSATGRRTPTRILTITTLVTGMQQCLLAASLHYASDVDQVQAAGIRLPERSTR
jgi:hypothetical protein